jgi:hypothetical protein
MVNLHRSVTIAIRPLCVPIAIALVVFCGLHLHGLLCLTNTTDAHLSVPGSKCLSLSKAAEQQQHSNGAPPFHTSVASFVLSFFPRCSKLQSHSQRPHAEPLFSSLLVPLACLLMNDPTGKTRPAVDKALSTLCACVHNVHTCMHGSSTASALGPQAQAGRQGKTI